MQKLFFPLFVLLTTTMYAQDYDAIKHKIDSLWKGKIRVKVKIFDTDFDSVSCHVGFAKKNRKLLYIREIHKKDPTSPTGRWHREYVFYQDRLVLISRWNLIPRKKPKKQIAFYYFENDKLLYTEESGTKITDPQAEFLKGQRLFDKFSKSNG